jgi:hypothetical protein
MGAYAKHGPVTQQNVVAYLAGPAARGQRQGCGDCQLTSQGYQDRGMALGGLWDHYANQRAGFEGLAALIRTHGVADGFRAYNGSGPAAVAYGRRSAVAYATWDGITRGLTPGPAPLPATPPRHGRHHPMAELPATPPPADPNSDPATWPQRSFDYAFDVAGGWEGDMATEFGVQEYGGRTVDPTRGFLRMASWIVGTGTGSRLVPVAPELAAGGPGVRIADHNPTVAWKAPQGAVGVTFNYAAPGGAYCTEGRSA